jgi:ABC-2 type transport system ATP-binding protein
MDEAIAVSELSKTYRVPVREAGVAAALKSLVNRRTRDVPAVHDVSFRVRAGEIVGFLGPNGAGKTTTLKMLAGLLHPTAGECRVLGHVPHHRDHDFLRRITLVMGQRNQLLWDIPVIDSFVRNAAIYAIPRERYRLTLDELVEMMELEELLDKPVRNLSLGERMKCEVAAALLHSPSVLFLDEPTIGLDVTMQRKLREYVQRYNASTGAAVLLTSHYMADIKALCERVIVIHPGILYDGALASLVERFSDNKTISVELSEEVELSGYGKVVTRAPGRVSLSVSRRDTAAITAKILAELPVVDLTIEDPPIEQVIEHAFHATN